MYTLSELNAQEYPRTLRISLNSNYWERRVESGIEFAYKDLGVSPSEFINNTSAASWDLNARVGGWIFRIATVNAILGMSNEGLECVGFSVGANFQA
jgi:hypothetical protein